jgi:hypothetical protein
VQTEDFAYDELGRMIRRDWRGLDFQFVTAIRWGEAGPESIERSDARGGIESWTFERCGDLDLTLPLAPVTSWQRETVPFSLGNELREPTFDVM